MLSRVKWTGASYCPHITCHKELELQRGSTVVPSTLVMVLRRADQIKRVEEVFALTKNGA